MVRRRASVVAVVAMILVAGCLAARPRSVAPAPILRAVPPGCDVARPALAHHADGRAAPDAPGPFPIPCSSATGFSAGEPTIGVDPKTGAVFYYPAGGFSDADPSKEVGVARSLDQGASWTRLLPSVAGASTHPATDDPYLYLDPRTGRLFVDDLIGVDCSFFSWSDDLGVTWTNDVVGCEEFDHQTVFAGPPVSSTTLGYPDVVYRCAIHGGAASDASTASTCLKSLDGGRTFIVTGTPPYVADPTHAGSMGIPGKCDGGLGHGTVGPDGAVYLPKGLCGEPFLASSHDEGLTWTRVRVSDLGMPMDATGTIDHEAGVAVDAAGNVYYGWVANDRMVHLAVSRDGGATWGPARNVSAPGLREASLGEITAAGVGKVAMVYMGSTDSPGGPFPSRPDCGGTPLQCILPAAPPRDYTKTTWNGYMMLTTDALAADPTYYTAAANDPKDPLVRGTCGVVRCQDVYDFLDVRIGPDGTPRGAFVDTCTGACSSDPAVHNGAHDGLVGRMWGGPGLGPD